MRTPSTLRPLRALLLALLLCAAASSVVMPNIATAYDEAALSKAGPKAKLKGADLSGANLAGADLEGAKLGRANLSGANLSGANLRKADLDKANLSGANLSGADLSTAKLGKANLSGARYDDATRWPRKFKIPSGATNVGGGAAAGAGGTTDAPAAASAASAGSDYTLTPADVVAVVNAAGPQIAACLSGFNAPNGVNMRWKVLGSGAAAEVTIVDPALASNPSATCARDVIAALTFPAHNKPLVPINNFPVKGQ